MTGWTWPPGAWRTAARPRMPQVQCVTRLRESGAPDRIVRLFLTFVAATDRMRDAALPWNNGGELFQSHPEIFEPDEASAIPISALRERLPQYGVSEFPRTDSRAWQPIARSIAAGGNPVGRVVESRAGNARELLSYVRTASGEQVRFPMLRGPEIGRMWVRMLGAPGGSRKDEIDIVPVAVDVHVRRVTKSLGVVDTGCMPDREGKRVIQDTWRAAVTRTRIGSPPRIANTCAALDPDLWFFGKYKRSQLRESATAGSRRSGLRPLPSLPETGP